jgi:hypothetical protein
MELVNMREQYMTRLQGQITFDLYYYPIESMWNIPMSDF